MNGPALSLGLRRAARAFALVLALALPWAEGHAADMPLAAGSPLAGLSFDDQPLILPIQRNFQMAMLTASSELGRTCGKMEAYGWRLAAGEQGRVNLIFNNNVDRLRAQGYKVETQNVRSVSSNVTLFTADREDKRLMLLWSAGDMGLVLVMCQTSAPLAATPRNILALPSDGASAPAAPMPLREASVPAPTRTAAFDQRKPIPLTRPVKAGETFSPLGSWTGSYSCAQGTTGATLDIASLKGDQFKGTFHFYPMDKNPNVPSGKYEVSGEYDRESRRILINPGKWIDHPKNYYNTIMIGGFDPVAGTFSAYFQGITGCTSFEAHQGGASEAKKADLSKAKPAKAKKANNPKPVKKAAPKKVAPVSEPVMEAPAGIDLDTLPAPIQ